jgi:hypothetical protein
VPRFGNGVGLGGGFLAQATVKATNPIAVTRRAPLSGRTRSQTCRSMPAL